MKKRYTEAQIIGLLRDGESGIGGDGTVPNARILCGACLPVAVKFGWNVVGRQALQCHAFRFARLSASLLPE